MAKQWKDICKMRRIDARPSVFSEDWEKVKSSFKKNLLANRLVDIHFFNNYVIWRLLIGYFPPNTVFSSRHFSPPPPFPSCICNRQPVFEHSVLWARLQSTEGKKRKRKKRALFFVFFIYKGREQLDGRLVNRHKCNTSHDFSFLHAHDTASMPNTY